MKNSDSDLISCEKCFTGFKYLNKEQTDLLNYEKSCSTYKKGEIIYHEGNKNANVYCVNDGILKLYKTGIDGKEQIIKFAKQGDLIGFRSILSNESSCTTAKVIEEAVLCSISSKLFMQLIKQNNNFAMYLMQVSCKELGNANKYILDLAQKTLRERVAEILILLYETFDIDDEKYIKVSLTREEIANMVGTATESVIRQLSEFKKEKIIDLKGRKIKVLNIEKIKKISEVF